MSEPAAASPTRLLRHRSFVRFWCARTFTNGAFMMQGVAVGWQMYDLTNNPLDLGLIGDDQGSCRIALLLCGIQTRISRVGLIDALIEDLLGQPALSDEFLAPFQVLLRKDLIGFGLGDLCLS